MIPDIDSMGAVALAAAIRAGKVSALHVVQSTLARIESLDEALNCFTSLTVERALAEAVEVDRRIAAGEDPGPLAGVPFAVKNLLDIAGLPTLAGSKIRLSASHALKDAAAVSALRNAGAILVGGLNMDEFAYGFTTENSHFGPTRNPHDLTRVAGGSSGGSGAAVAAGMVPLSLGSDTNGSIRVPAAFCGIFGLKPTYGRVSRAGAFLFSSSLDHIGPLARSVEDLALAFDLLQGHDPDDPVSSHHPIDPCSPTLRLGPAGLRISVAGGYFESQSVPEASEAVSVVAAALNVQRTLEIPEAARARAAAYIITASEGGSHHLGDLLSSATDFDPLTRSRFLSGALLPAAWVHFAQRFRAWYRAEVQKLFETVDVILAPTTPCPAIRVGQSTMMLDGKEVPSRANLGIFTQPISFIGLPVISVPIHLPGKMPMGVQLIAAPFNEEKLFRVAWQLESQGTVSAPVANAFAGILEAER